MTLNAFVVLKMGGVPIYSKIIDENIKLNSILLSGLVSAVQSFAHEITKREESYIKEMKMENLIFSYRIIEDFIFVGASSSEENIKQSKTALEYLILAFLTRYRKILRYEAFPEFYDFEEFDNFFLKYRDKREKELKKWLQKEFEMGSLLEGLLNQMINYFPIKEVVKVKQNKLIIIGNKLIAVRFDINDHEEKQIIEELKNKTHKVFGTQLFDSILKKVEEKLILR